MSAFENTHGSKVTGSLAMFDRMIFRGHLTGFFPSGAVRVFLWKQGVPLTEFGAWAQETTDTLCQHAHSVAKEAGRPVVYLEHNTTRDTGQTKEDLARRIAERDGVTEGLVCVVRSIEPCTSFNLRRNHATHQLEVIRRQRKCVHLYFYLVDPEFGFMHIKVQTWLPFPVQVYLKAERGWSASSTPPASATSATPTPCCESMTSKPPRICASASLIGLGPGCSTPSPAVSTRTCRPSSSPALAATTGCSIRRRSPPTSCSKTGLRPPRCCPTWSATPA